MPEEDKRKQKNTKNFDIKICLKKINKSIESTRKNKCRKNQFKNILRQLKENDELKVLKCMWKQISSRDDAESFSAAEVYTDDDVDSEVDKLIKIEFR